MNNEETKKLISYLVKKRGVYGKEEFEVPGTAFKDDLNISSTLAKDILIYLDTQNYIYVWVCDWNRRDYKNNKEFTWLRYKDWIDHHLDLDPITIAITKKQLHNLENLDLVGEFESIKTDSSIKWNQKTGDVTYIAPSGKVFTGTMNPGTNQYDLLNYLIQNPAKVFGYEVLDKQFKEVRLGVDSRDPIRRVSDAAKAVRRELNVSGGDDIFKVSKGFGVFCKIEIENPQ